MRLRPILALILLAVPALAADDGFSPLVTGTDPAQFELVGLGPEAVKVADGEVRLAGKPDGYFATKGSYQDFVLHFDFMYERPAGLAAGADFGGNSGLLVNIQGPAKVWPKCIEFQLQNQSVGQVIPVKGGKVDGHWDRAKARKATKPVGEWNHMEVTSKAGAMTCTLNGVEVATAADADPDRGQIGWQSEGAAIRFRDLRIKAKD